MSELDKGRYTHNERMVKMFEILVENLKTGKIYPSGFVPCSHEEACVLLSKMPVHKWRRNFLKPSP